MLTFILKILSHCVVSSLVIYTLVQKSKPTRFIITASTNIHTDSPADIGVARGRAEGADCGNQEAAAKGAAKMGMIRGQQASHDFWGWQNCSPPQVQITHATPLPADSDLKQGAALGESEW